MAESISDTAAVVIDDDSDHSTATSSHRIADDDVMDLMFNYSVRHTLLRQVDELLVGSRDEDETHRDMEDRVLAVLDELRANRDGGGVRRAAAASVPALERLEYRVGVGGVECVICIRDYKVGDELSVMPCEYRHRFHRGCIEEWLLRSRVCPLCRHALPIC